MVLCRPHAANLGTIAAISGSAAAVFEPLAAQLHADAAICALECGVMQAGDPLEGSAEGSCSGDSGGPRGGGGVCRAADDGSETMADGCDGVGAWGVEQLAS